MYDRFDGFAHSPFDGFENIDPTEELLLPEARTGDLSMSASSRSPRDIDASDAVLSTTLPVSSKVAFEAFCRIEETPVWVSALKSVRILSRTVAGRAKRAAYTSRLSIGKVGYTVHYRYNEQQRQVSWGTAPGSLTLVSGHAKFTSLGDRATLMEYQLTLELPEGARIAADASMVGGHASSLIMNDFRDYVVRYHR